jgi:hypothetical protein
MPDGDLYRSEQVRDLLNEMLKCYLYLDSFACVAVQLYLVIF